MDVVEWAIKGCELEAGEILLTSIDKEGTRKGFDFDLINTVSKNVPIPVIASGGMGCYEDLEKVVVESFADAVAMADILHYDRLSISDIRKFCKKNKINVRNYEA